MVAATGNDFMAWRVSGQSVGKPYPEEANMQKGSPDKDALLAFAGVEQIVEAARDHHLARQKVVADLFGNKLCDLVAEGVAPKRFADIEEQAHFTVSPHWVSPYTVVAITFL